MGGVVKRKPLLFHFLQVVIHKTTIFQPQNRQFSQYNPRPHEDEVFWVNIYLLQS